MARVALRLVRGARAGELIALEDNQTIIIGRGSESTFRIQDPSISRRHCQIANTPRGLLIADLQSSNGTYVNNERLCTGWAQLNPADVVVLGRNEVRDRRSGPLLQTHSSRSYRPSRSSFSPRTSTCGFARIKAPSRHQKY